jgi:chemotaxis protein methyltransferase WspC
MAPEPERPAAPTELPTALLDEAATLADRGRYDEATRLCERSIREADPSARAFFLLGMIRQVAGDRAQAEAHFKKAVYLDPQHEEGLLALALLAERRGDAVEAAGYRRRAGRVLKKKGTR